jgi:hypothetical protein
MNKNIEQPSDYKAWYIVESSNLPRPSKELLNSLNFSKKAQYLSEVRVSKVNSFSKNIITELSTVINDFPVIELKNRKEDLYDFEINPTFSQYYLFVSGDLVYLVDNQGYDYARYITLLDGISWKKLEKTHVGLMSVKEGKLNNNESMLYFISNELPTGTIANHSSVSDYKSIDKIRSEMLKILKKKDMKYSLDALVALIKQAEGNLSLNESKKDEFIVYCYDGSYQFWASTDDKNNSIKSLEDAHEIGQEHCIKDGMWYSIRQNNQELFSERRKNVKGKFVKTLVSESEITTDEEFKAWAETVLKKAHGEKYDAEIMEKMAKDLKEKYKGNYGAMVGALSSGLGESLVIGNEYLVEGVTAKYVGKSKDKYAFIIEGELVKVDNPFSNINESDLPKSLVSFLERFPDDAKSWKDATEEILDMAKYIDELLEIVSNPKGKSKTPAEWNQRHKSRIIENFPKLHKYDQEGFLQHFEGLLKESVVKESEITSDEEFKAWAETVLKKAHGDKYDAKIMEKMAKDLKEKYKGNYGAMVGALSSGLGANESETIVEFIKPKDVKPGKGYLTYGYLTGGFQDVDDEIRVKVITKDKDNNGSLKMLIELPNGETETHTFKPEAKGFFISECDEITTDVRQTLDAVEELLNKYKDSINYNEAYKTLSNLNYLFNEVLEQLDTTYKATLKENQVIIKNSLQLLKESKPAKVKSNEKDIFELSQYLKTYDQKIANKIFEWVDKLPTSEELVKFSVDNNININKLTQAIKDTHKFLYKN